jgi:hypothetical protein
MLKQEESVSAPNFGHGVRSSAASKFIDTRKEIIDRQYIIIDIRYVIPQNSIPVGDI